MPGFPAERKPRCVPTSIACGRAAATTASNPFPNVEREGPHTSPRDNRQAVCQGTRSVSGDSRRPFKAPALGQASPTGPFPPCDGIRVSR